MASRDLPHVHPSPTLGAEDSERALLERVISDLAATRGELLLLGETLEGEKIPSTALESLEHVGGSLLALQSRVEQRVILLRLKRRQMDVDLQSVDILRVLQELTRQFAATCRQERKPLCLEAVESVVVMADVDLLQRLLETLLVTALSHGLPNCPVIVDVEQDEHTAAVHFVSQGCEEDKSNCPCDRHVGEGNDERLSFCQSIAAAHSGEVISDRAVGNMGVCYSVILPKAPPSEGAPFLPANDLDELVDE